jgi:hypothetical protein
VTYKQKRLILGHGSADRKVPGWVATSVRSQAASAQENRRSLTFQQLALQVTNSVP